MSPGPQDAQGLAAWPVIAFTDLDDTLFQTRRKCPAGDLFPAAFSRDGLAMSFFTGGQRVLVDMLLEKAALVPVTARSSEALARVAFPCAHGAIVSYGGLILDARGDPDPVWRAGMADVCARAAPALDFALRSAEEAIARWSLHCRARLVSDAGLDFYVVIKNTNQRLEELDFLKSRLEEALAGRAMHIHANDNNLSLLPDHLSKEAALAHFLETRIRPLARQPLVLGLGDSLSDVGFLRLCQYIIIPSASQIARTLPQGDTQA